MRRTKIVCTLGPASRSPEVIRGLIMAGMNVARLNFSHGTHEEHAATIALVRRLAWECDDSPVAILQDLCGPKIRTGPLASGKQRIDLHPGATFTLTTEPCDGTEERVSVSYEGLAREVKNGDRLLLSDGDIELEVVEPPSATEVKTRVVNGGALTGRKGVNAPTATLSIAALTEKDKVDLRFGVEHGVDFVALSFVRRAADVDEARALARGTPIVAKIEKHEAIEAIDAIVDRADGVMVARGDLGVELPLERVPLAQKLIIRKANLAGKPVITATQMLRSMVENPRPTRAEASDVANAIFDGTDAVMLSEETAAGIYPVRAAATLARIAEAAEGPELYAQMRARDLGAARTVADVVSRSAVEIAEALDARAIVCPTLSGTTARLVSRYRPRQPIVAFSPSDGSVRRLSLSWGVVPRHGAKHDDAERLIHTLERDLVRLKLCKPGDRAVMIAGLPAGVAGKTNFVRVEEIE